jgi:RecG-like helicase
VYYVIYYYSHVVNKSGYDNIIVKFISYLNSLYTVINDNNSNEHTNSNDDAITTTTNDSNNIINEILSVSKEHLNIKEYLIFIEKQLDILLDNNNTSQQQSSLPHHKQLISLYINTLPLFLTSKQSNPHSHAISNDDYDSIITFIKKHKDTKETITSSLPNEIKIELRNRDLIFFGDL